MVGSFGCPCEKCQGSGTISMQLRSKLCAIERLLGVDIVVTMGYRCSEVNLPVRESKHSPEDGVSLAVDFFPRNRVYEKDGKRWGTRRFDFLELVRPYFDQAWICTAKNDHNKWSIHGEIDEERTVSFDK